MEEKIRQKLSELNKQREMIIAQLNAIAGAEQAYSEMLTELEKGVNNEPDKDKNG